MIRASGASAGGKLRLCLAALLCGASGLGLEVLVVALCGLTLGYGASAAVGLTVFLVGWSLGALLSGRLRRGSAWPLVVAGLTLASSAFLAPSILVQLGATAPAVATAWAVSILLLLLIALPQGVFLPQLAARWDLTRRGDLGLLLGSNLLGAASGAWFLGHQLPAVAGRGAASLVGGGLALLAALLGASVSSQGADREPRLAAAGPSEPADERELTPLTAGLILAVATGWLGTLEWLGLRLGVLWFGGMQPALTGVLIASMLALALGAWAGPRVLGPGERGRSGLVLAGLLGTSWWLLAPWALAQVAGAPLLVRALVLVGPTLLPFGAVVPVLHRDLQGESGARLGNLFAFEALGALVGLPISYLWLLPAVGLNGTLAAWALVAGVTGVALGGACRGARAGIALAAGGLAGAIGWVAQPLALSSPALSNPALELLEFVEDRNFAVAVVEDGVLGERTVMTDGFRAAGTGRDYAYMQALGHLPLLMHPAPERVAVLAFGTGTTAGSVSLHPEVEQLDVLELSAAVASQADWFTDVNHAVLEQRDRVRLRLGDGRRSLAAATGRYDVLTMEPLLPDSPFGVYLYTEEFYARARTSLAPGGLLCQWVPPHALEPNTFEAVVAAFTEAFPWSSVWVFGTQVVLLGGEKAPLLRTARFPDPASELGERLSALGLGTPAGLAARWVSSGATWEAPARRLTDLDPWVIFAPERGGLDRLGDLPINLELLRRRSERPPIEWLVGLPGDEAVRLQEALSILRSARIAWAAEERSARGGTGMEVLAPRSSEELLVEALALAPEDPEVRAFAEEVEFLDVLRAGVGALAGSETPNAAASAVRSLNRALSLRPERADVHWYMAAALERLGRPEAQEAAARARELCPQIARTPAGLRVASWR